METQTKIVRTCEGTEYRVESRGATCCDCTEHAVRRVCFGTIPLDTSSEGSAHTADDECPGCGGHDVCPDADEAE